VPYGILFHADVAEAAKARLLPTAAWKSRLMQDGEVLI